MTSDKDAEIAELKSTVAELETRLAEAKVNVLNFLKFSKDSTQKNRSSILSHP